MEKLSDVALNGTQVQAAKQIVVDYSQGILARDSAVAMLVYFFQLPRNVAEEIVVAPAAHTPPQPPVATE